MDPFELSWARFCFFLSGLPADAALVGAFKAEEEAGDWNALLDRQLGYEAAAGRQRVSMDTFMGMAG